jgi:hypothetical protein
MAAVDNRHGSEDAIRQVLSYLLAERQQLRSRGADKAALEANRQATVAMQSRLNRLAAEELSSQVDTFTPIS